MSTTTTARILAHLAAIAGPVLTREIAATLHAPHSLVVTACHELHSAGRITRVENGSGIFYSALVQYPDMPPPTAPTSRQLTACLGVRCCDSRTTRP